MLRQTYYEGPSGAEFITCPSEDSGWSTPTWPKDSPGEATLESGDGVVLIAGEAATSPCNGPCSDCSGWSHLGIIIGATTMTGYRLCEVGE